MEPTSERGRRLLSGVKCYHLDRTKICRTAGRLRCRSPATTTGDARVHARLSRLRPRRSRLRGSWCRFRSRATAAATAQAGAAAAGSARPRRTGPLGRGRTALRQRPDRVPAAQGAGGGGATAGRDRADPPAGAAACFREARELGVLSGQVGDAGVGTPICGWGAHLVTLPGPGRATFEEPRSSHRPLVAEREDQLSGVLTREQLEQGFRERADAAFDDVLP